MFNWFKTKKVVEKTSPNDQCGKNKTYLEIGKEEYLKSKEIQKNYRQKGIIDRENFISKLGEHPNLRVVVSNEDNISRLKLFIKDKYMFTVSFYGWNDFSAWEEQTNYPFTSKKEFFKRLYSALEDAPVV